MRTRPATGLQLAFLMFAVLLLSAPLGSYLLTGQLRSDQADPLVVRIIPFAIFGLCVVLIPALGRQAGQLLRAPIAASHRLEVVIVALAMIPLTWATTGARALWTWWSGDAAALATMKVNDDAEWQHAFSLGGVVLAGVSVIVAPVLEELVCRGFLYRAFERDWGWLPAVIATSLIFGAYHSFFLNAFTFAIVVACLMRRTGSLRSAIVVHAFSNLMAWWPLMGQHVFPDSSLPPERMSTWTVNLVSLGVAAIALPTYVWMSRDRTIVAPTQFLEPNASLSK